jgi:Fe2+ or Zn2+ uptake regulation protein/O6-methylguanine-DNA--protein-cysteine methyltransferase
MSTDRDPGELLRARGLRVTPQRRAILGAFRAGASEHLSADEIHARAASVVPELGRGTVYATLAELTELGILLARGTPEPVRYETNTAPHQHFRCRVCLRTFDVDLPEPSTASLQTQGFAVEQVMVTAEGVCAECVDYDEGLRASAQQARSRPSPGLPSSIAARTADTPLGPVFLGATASGLVRLVFDGHADVPALTAAMRARRGPRAARDHVARGAQAVEAYFAGQEPGICEIDWEQLDGTRTLQAAMAVPRGAERSYDLLDTPADAGERGRVLGANPLVLLVPCHRVMRGREVPADYVGGAERRLALRALERD